MAESGFTISAQTVEIRVEPERMIEKASSVEGRLGGLTESLARFEEKVNATSYYWVGEAGELYRGKYRDSKEEINGIIARIRSNTAKLRSIAQQSSENEKEVTEIAESLMEQVIF